MKLLKAVAPILGVFSVALLVRLFYNVTVAQGYQPNFDAALYYQIAGRMLTEHCYCFHPFHPTVSRSPLWPFVMAGLYAITGQHVLTDPGAVWTAQLFYCILGSGTCVLTYLFARELFGKRIALVTGLIAAVYCGLFLYDGWLFADPLYTFLLTFFIYALYHLQKSLSLYKQFEGIKGFKGFWQRHNWTIVSGIVLGLMTLTRPNGIGFLVLLFIWGIFVARNYGISWRLVGKEILLIACLAACIVAPWTYRNYQQSHSFVLVATGMGEVLLGAYNDRVLNEPGVLSMWMPPVGSKIHDSVGYTPQDDSADTAKALSWMRAHPGSVVYLMGQHLINMWKPYTYTYTGLPMEQFPNRPASQIMRQILPIESFPIFIMAAAGLLVTLKKRWNQLFLVYLVLAFTIAENVVFYGSMRFRAPIEPLLVLLTGGFLWWVARVVAAIKEKRALQLAEAA